ncbi:MAG: hypothetical protein IID36_08790 [Planctomycetes bacterium]|nr:hypothetical protein [Planctomycetota bacterium]
MTEQSWPPRSLEPTDHFIDEKQPDWHLNACVGRQLPNERGGLYYSDGFRSAARRLVEDLIERPDIDLPVDTAVYPIVFLYRHNLELLLKFLIVRGRWLISESGDQPRGHRLDKLWMTARPIVERCFDEADWSQNDIVTSLMSELSGLDPNGEAARYMESNKGMKHFAELALLNIRHFADIAERLSEYLSTVLGTIEMMDSQRCEC